MIKINENIELESTNYKINLITINKFHDFLKKENINISEMYFIFMLN
jgi:hypothetical protein